MLSSCLREESDGGRGAAPGSHKSEARAAFEAAASMLGKPAEPGDTFSPGEYTPMWNGAVTATAGGVRYTTVPINTHFYYVADWDTPNGKYRTEVIQRLVVTKNLASGTHECYIATFVPRDSYSRWSQSPAKRFVFGGQSHKFHGLLFLTALDGTPCGFYGYDNGKQIFDSQQDYKSQVMKRILATFGSQGKIEFNWFWLTRGGEYGVPDDLTDDECRICFDHSEDSGCYPIDPANPDGKWFCKNNEISDNLNLGGDEKDTESGNPTKVTEEILGPIIDDMYESYIGAQLVDNLFVNEYTITYYNRYHETHYEYAGLHNGEDRTIDVYIHGGDCLDENSGFDYIMEKPWITTTFLDETSHAYQYYNYNHGDMSGNRELEAKVIISEYAESVEYEGVHLEGDYWAEINNFRLNPCEDTYDKAVGALKNAKGYEHMKYSEKYDAKNFSNYNKLTGN